MPRLRDPGGEDVARKPTHVRTELFQGLDEDSGLDVMWSDR
jgi:hypothetical protein